MTTPEIDPATVQQILDRLIEQHGAGQAGRIRRGVEQAARRWWPEDGGPEDFAAFCAAHFLADPEALAATFGRLEKVLEQVDGHLHEVRRELTWPIDVDTGPVGTADRLLANLDLQAHVDEDLFRTKVAFLALLNFPVHTLAERLPGGAARGCGTRAGPPPVGRLLARGA